MDTLLVCFCLFCFVVLVYAFRKEYKERKEREQIDRFFAPYEDSLRRAFESKRIQEILELERQRKLHEEFDRKLRDFYQTGNWG